jgi:hypothetical protein
MGEQVSTGGVRVWITKHTKGREKRERLSCVPWPFATFAIQAAYDRQL